MAVRFGLSRLLDVRELKERAGQQRLAQAVAAVEDERGRLQQIEARWRGAQSWMERRMEGAEPAGSLEAFSQCVRELACAWDGQRAALEQATREMEERQMELAALWRDRETLSRLERRHRQLARQESVRREQRVLDDLALSGHKRTNKEA